MNAKHLYEYSVVRYVPNVEREEFINVGLIMMCKRQRWLKAQIEPDFERISIFNPTSDAEEILFQLNSFIKIAEKQPGGGPVAELDDVTERFRWLSAVRSSSIQTSMPHPGLCEDLDLTFNRLFNQLVK